MPIPTTHDALIRRAAERYLPFDWRVLKAQLWQESRFAPDARSPVGAEGIAQFMPPTWADVAEELEYPEVATPDDPEWAVPAAAHYMGKLYGAWHWPRPEWDRICLALASYNAGLGNIVHAQAHADFASGYAPIIAQLQKVTHAHASETVGYVRRVLRFSIDLTTRGH